MESEALKLLGNRIGGIDHIYRSVDLQPVVVHDHAQIVEFLGCREHGCLPHLSLLDLAVAQKRVYTVVLIAELRGECHAHRDGNSLAQRSAGSVHSRRVLYTGMSLEMGADVAQGQKILHREISPVGQRRVESRSRVSLGQHEAIPIRFLRILGINVHLLKIEIRKNLCR